MKSGHLKRREFITLLGGATAAWPLAVNAQRASAHRLGIFVYNLAQADPQIFVFKDGLRELGYVDGQNLSMAYRSAEGRSESLLELAKELAALRPQVLVGFGGDVVPSLKQAAGDTPVVFSISSDPVRQQLVASLARPGGNATGVTFLQDELASKRLQLFKEAVPRISRVACIWNPEHFDNELAEAQRAAKVLNTQLLSFEIKGADNVDGVLRAAREANVDALYVVSSGKTVRSIPSFVAFSRENRIPLVGGWGTWAQNGGLLSYGPDVFSMVRRCASYVDKILKGTLPSDLPVEQPTKFELLVNLQAAKHLGLTISEAFLLRADRVIE